MSKNQKDDPTDTEKKDMKINILKNEIGIIENHDRFDRRKVQKKDLDTELETQRKQWQHRYETEMENIIITEKHIRDLGRENLALEQDITKLRDEKEDLKENHESEIKKYLEQWKKDEAREKEAERIAEDQWKVIDNFMKKEKAELLKEVAGLEDQLRRQQELKDKIAVEKDQEKTEATDKLKKYMLEKIQITKTELFALRKEHLDSKTRLTVLQNYQLTTELEYQSKQTENLFFKNQKLIQHVNALKRDVEIHKQVEGELAKRSHFCQKLIKKLKSKIKDTQLEKEEFQAEIENNKRMTEEKREENQKSVARLTIMRTDQEKFEEKLNRSKAEYEFSLEQHNQKRHNLASDVRKLKSLLRLFERYLVIVGREDSKLNLSQHTQSNSITEENRTFLEKDGFRNLAQDQKETVLRGVISLLNNQLEEYGTIDIK